MARECNTTKMGINIRDSLLTAFLKATVSILGQMALYIVETSSKAIEMAMESGLITLPANKITKDTTCWIKSMAMGYMIGEMVTYIKEASLRTKGVGKDSYSTTTNWFMRVFGLMGRGVMKMSITQPKTQ